MKFFKTAAVISVSLAAALLSACESDTSGGSVTFYNSENPYTQEMPGGANIPTGDTVSASQGTPAVISGFEITLLDSQIYGFAKQDAMHTTDSDYVACRFELKNNGSEDAAYSSSDFYMIENGSKKDIPITGFSLMEASDIEGYEPFDGTVSPGESKTGYVVFEIHTDWNNIDLVYNPSANNPDNDSVKFTLNKNDIK